MINIIKQEIPIDESLKKKLEFICDFCNTTPTFINGSIRKIDKYVSETMALIRTLPFDDRFGLKILITQYFEDMRNGNKKSMQQLKDVLRHAGLTKLANRLQNESWYKNNSKYRNLIADDDTFLVTYNQSKIINR